MPNELYPHLPSSVAERPAQRPTSSSVAAAMYPNLPQPPPPAWIKLDREAVKRRLWEIQAKWAAERRKRRDEP
jgi:hypothetical protein